MYRTTGAGKDPVPPAQMAMALLLQAYHGISDAEAVEMTVVDLRWQMVLDCLGATRPAFSQGALSNFRERLIAHDMDRRLLERTTELARRTDGFDWKKLMLLASMTAGISTESFAVPEPEVDFDNSYLIQLVLFFVFVLVMKPLLFDPMLKLFEEREKKTIGAKISPLVVERSRGWEKCFTAAVIPRAAAGDDWRDRCSCDVGRGLPASSIEALHGGIFQKARRDSVSLEQPPRLAPRAVRTELACARALLDRLEALLDAELEGDGVV